MPSIEWKVAGASVVGFGHLAGGKPCQDFHAVSSSIDGWIVAVVSDGAGTARRCTDGAKAVCEGIVSRVTPKLRQAGDSPLDQATARTWVEEAVESVRMEITEKTAAASLADFHATLVGVIAGPRGGLFFHIGDGAGCATESKTFSQYVLSPPENGEYANETYFFTESEWRQHLRLTSFGREFDLVMLMSDGVTPFALARGATGPYVPFFEPLTRYLASHTREEGERALAATLERDAIRPITDDDKTLLWALRTEADGE